MKKVKRTFWGVVDDRKTSKTKGELVWQFGHVMLYTDKPTAEKKLFDFTNFPARVKRIVVV